MTGGVRTAFAQLTLRAREPVVVRVTPDLLPDFVGQGLPASSFEVWRFWNGSWQFAPFQIKVKIYAATTAGGPYGLVDSGTNSHCQDGRTIGAGSGTYFITLKAVDVAGNASIASNEVQVTVP
jgi:hypothetical protein